MTLSTKAKACEIRGRKGTVLLSLSSALFVIVFHLSKENWYKCYLWTPTSPKICTEIFPQEKFAKSTPDFCFEPFEAKKNPIFYSMMTMINWQNIVAALLIRLALQDLIDKFAAAEVEDEVHMYSFHIFNPSFFFFI